MSIFASTASCCPVEGISPPPALLLPAVWGNEGKKSWLDASSEDETSCTDKMYLWADVWGPCVGGTLLSTSQVATCQMWKFHQHPSTCSYPRRTWNMAKTWCHTSFSHTVGYIMDTRKRRPPICFVWVAARKGKCWAATAVFYQVYLSCQAEKWHLVSGRKGTMSKEFLGQRCEEPHDNWQGGKLLKRNPGGARSKDMPVTKQASGRCWSETSN